MMPVGVTLTGGPSSAQPVVALVWPVQPPFIVVTTPALPTAVPATLDLMKALAAWAMAAVSNYSPAPSVVWLDQLPPKLTKPFIGLNIRGPFSATGIGWQEQLGNATGISAFYTVTVEAYTDAPTRDGATLDAAQFISDLRLALDDPELADQLNQAGIGVGPINAPVDLSQLLDTKFERRMAFDFEANVLISRVNNAGNVIQSITQPTVVLVP